MADADRIAMLNRADSPYRSRPDVHRSSADRNFDGHPGWRIAVLFGGIAIALSTIAVRLMFVQTQLSEEYAAEFDRTVERFEAIPSHDGRIIAADGEVLAEDQQVFGLKVHYRWLEQPPDPAWLKAQALSRLDRQSRRNPDCVAREREHVLQLRHQLWQEISNATGVNAKLLVARRREIQRRVEHIYDLVESRRALKDADRSNDDTDDAADSSTDNSPDESVAGFWSGIWQSVVQALTTPPIREATEPLVIREQLDYHLLVPEMPMETAVEVEAHPELFPGTRVVVETRRVYPLGGVAPHLVGYRTPIDDETLQARRRRFPNGDPLDYQTGDRLGRTGLELSYERHLRGLRGRRKLVLNRRGEVVRTADVREPRYGQDLVLSLCLPLQQDAERLLDDCLEHEQKDETNGKPLPIPPGGAIIALDVRTGAVLAAATAPRFDLSLFVEHDDAAWSEVLADPRKPLFHRATDMALPPGSIFKVLSAIAFLETGRLDPDRPFHCQGYLDEPDRYRCLIFRNFGVSHGDLNLVDALARSCNVYFFDAARRIGAAPISEWGTRFGFGRPTGIDLPGERGGNLPIIELPHGTDRRATRSNGDALQLAIGQARLTTTPLQVARLMAAIANGGKLVVPRLVDSSGPTSIATSSDEYSIATATASRIPELTPRTLDIVRRGLEKVVADPQGTGYKTVRLAEVSIAGKTGTAEPGGGKPDHAWFAGYVPADRPKIAFVVVLENAGSGGHAAGPVARKLVQAFLAHGLLDGRRAAAPSAN
jgi:penicillin-binding protein 2